MQLLSGQTCGGISLPSHRFCLIESDGLPKRFGNDRQYANRRNRQWVTWKVKALARVYICSIQGM